VKQRHIRPGDELRSDEVIVIRGGEFDRAVLRSDAVRYHSIYGTYGISVVAARDVTVDELAQQPPLIRFDVLTLVELVSSEPRVSGARTDRTEPSAFHSCL
jgi:hypothetical protein